MSAARRVWITGIGLLTPLSSSREGSWQRSIAGERGLRRLATDDMSLGEWPERSAGGPVMLDGVEESGSLLTTIARAAASEAIADAGIDVTAADRERFGCVVGTSKGCMRSFAMQCRAAMQSRRDARSESALPEQQWLDSWPSGPTEDLAQAFDLRGPLLAPVTACATGLACVVRGADLIRDGVCDAVLVGSTDASLTPAMLASFRRLGVLAKGDDEPAFAVKPFDRNRSGFFIGEGAAMFVLEAAEHAHARGKTAYAQWLAGGGLADATGLTQLNSDPAALVRLIGDTLRRSTLSSCEIDYISLHGTATTANDDVEARAILRAFGGSAQRLSCSSLKGSIGHLLGAAGSVEFAAMLLAMRDGVVPPTLNLNEPEFDLDFVPHVAKQRRVDAAMKLSLGFGGHLVAGIVTRP